MAVFWHATGSFVRILGIETSCDETGLAVVDAELGLIGHALHSQVDLHQRYGGVVPELASRDHLLRLVPLVEQVLADANTTPQQLDGIAYTQGPGLVGALLVGATFAKALSLGWAVPSLGIHHLEGHLAAPLLEASPPAYPFLALLVSGGHTQLLSATAFGQYELLGDTLDDAVGEAFDKTAKLLGLPYPGGPHLAKLATQGALGRFTFTRPMLDRPGLNFSFSGLKTQALTCIRQHGHTEQDKADIAHAFQQAAIDTLCKKVARALTQTQLKRIVIAGGVGANQLLRQQMQQLAKQQGCQVYYPRPEFCTDNGAMIAMAGLLRMQQGLQDPDFNVQVKPRWPLETL